MKYTYPDFIAKWIFRFQPNTTFTISEADLQEFALDIVDTFGVTVANVPEYVPGTPYTVGTLVRYTPINGKEAFYYALHAGQLPAPIGVGDLNWKVVPGPVKETELSQAIDLVQAQGLDQTSVKAGRTYLIDFGADAQGFTQTVSVRGVSNDRFDIEGTLEVNGQRTAVTDVDVQAGTWKVKAPVDAYTKAQADALLATKQGAVTEQVETAINGANASLTRLNLGKYVRLITSQNTVVDLPPVTLSDVGQLLVLYNYAGPGSTATLTLQAKRGTDANATYLTTLPRTYVVLVEVVKIVRGTPYNDVVAGYAVLALTTLDASPPVTPAQLDAVATTLPLRPEKTNIYDSLLASDIGGIVPVNNPTGTTLTIPAGLGLPAPAGGTTGAARICYLLQTGVGLILIDAAQGVSVKYPPTQGYKSKGQYARLVLTWLDTDTVLVEGGVQ